MDKDERIRRLKTIEGHIRGIERMVEEEAYCIDLIKQIQAAQAALHRVNSEILSDHLHSCLIKAVRGGDPDERERVLKEIAEVYDVAVHPRRR